MKILVTGSAGFIGFHLAVALLKNGHQVVGIDNLNDYYDVNLKYARLIECGIDPGLIQWNTETVSERYDNYRFVKLNLEDKPQLCELFMQYSFDAVVNLAAQAGVRYSIINPDVYVQSNVVGFLNVLEACRHYKTGHLVYASSSSVYGLNEQIPFSTSHNVNHPVSLYAATKKANELMAHAYSHLYNLPTTGLRFFTVYGPWGRPDMAYSIFSDAILNDKPIQVFNNGNMKRDFTFIDDVVAGIQQAIYNTPRPDQHWNAASPHGSSSSAPYRLFNIGNNKPVNLMRFIRQLELHLGKKAIIEMKGMQAGDVVSTWADIDDSISEFNYAPDTTVEEGLAKFSAWYQHYYAVASKLEKAVA